LCLAQMSSRTEIAGMITRNNAMSTGLLFSTSAL
jgi:hypothetical protein